MSQLRVAYLAHSVDERRGGMELVSARLLERLAPHVALEVVAGDGLDTLAGGVRRTRVPIPDAPSLARLVVFAALGSWRLRAVRRRNDLVHANGAVTCGRVDVVTVHLSHAAVIEAQGSPWPPGRRRLRGALAALRRVLAARLERAQLRPGRVRVVVALTAAGAADLRRRFPGVQVEVIPDGADVERLAAVARRDREGGAPLRVAVVAGDFGRKGVKLAIEAVAATSRCRLRVLGRGDLAAMRRLVEHLGGTGRIEVLGHRDDVAAELACADVLLSCSAHESFGLALVEGAAAGCAVVCTDTGVGPELVGPGDGGVVVPADRDAIASVLEALDAEPARCAAMGEVARARSLRFTFDAMADATLSLYDRLASAT